jgi:hypothetical protein
LRINHITSFYCTFQFKNKGEDALPEIGDKRSSIPHLDTGQLHALVELHFEKCSLCILYKSGWAQVILDVVVEQ